MELFLFCNEIELVSYLFCDFFMFVCMYKVFFYINICKKNIIVCYYFLCVKIVNKIKK